MGTFKGKFLLIGFVSLLFCSLFLFYSVYRIVSMDEVIEHDKRFFIPATKELSYLEALFQSYQFEINKMISQPAKHDPYEIQNNPLKLQIDEKLELLSRMIYSFSSRYRIDDASGYMVTLENISKSFRNYNISAAAVVEAFSSENRSGSQGFFNISEFVSIIRKSEDQIFRAVNSLNYEWDQQIILGASSLAKQFNNIKILLVILWVIVAVSMVLFVLYAKQVSNHVLTAVAGISKIRSGRFSPDELKSRFPKPSDLEPFELLDGVLKLSRVVYDEMEGFKNRINFLENDNARNKVVATYTSAIVNSLNEAILVTDDLLRVSFINEAFERIWKIKRSSVVDTEVVDLPFIRMVNGWKEALSKALLSDGKKAIINFKGDFKVSTKMRKKLDFCVMPLKDSSGKRILGTITVVRD